MPVNEHKQLLDEMVAFLDETRDSVMATNDFTEEDRVKLQGLIGRVPRLIEANHERIVATGNLLKDCIAKRNRPAFEKYRKEAAIMLEEQLYLRKLFAKGQEILRKLKERDNATE